jgi:hypothetical protein
MPWGTAYDTTTISPDTCKRSSTPAGFSANRLRQYSGKSGLACSHFVLMCHQSTVRFGMTCCTELRLGSKSYITMTMMWTIIIAWLAIQLPLGVLIGKVIKFGTGGYAKRSPSSDPGIVWC